MMTKFSRILSFFVLINILPASSQDEVTVGLITHESGAFSGYTLFAPNQSTTVYLIDMEGNKVHSWASQYEPGQSVYLLDNGHLLRTSVVRNRNFSAGGSGGLVQEIDWNGDLIWEFQFSSQMVCQHHDIERLPNGNVLFISWEYKSFVEAVTAGRNPETLKSNKMWPDFIVEIQPNNNGGAEIVWEWHVWDHLIQDYDESKANYGNVAEHPELIDINYTSGTLNSEDWMHSNSIDYNAELDQILLSVRHFDEIWIIDHSTTTAEAAGHSGGTSGKGGDLLYRWGNPRTYRAGTLSDQKLFKQHDASWISKGMPGENNILIFNNGEGRGYTTVDEISPPLLETSLYERDGSVYGPNNCVWTFRCYDPPLTFASNISGAQRLVNGNTLICYGPFGTFLEVTTNNQIVWEYINPVTRDKILNQGDDPSTRGSMLSYNNSTFRAYRYALDYQGLYDKNLSSQGPLEKYPNGVPENNINPKNIILSQNFPNPFNSSTVFSYSLPISNFVRLIIYNSAGQKIKELDNGYKNAGEYNITWNGCDENGDKVPSGIYFYQLQSNGIVLQGKMSLIE